MLFKDKDDKKGIKRLYEEIMKYGVKQRRRVKVKKRNKNTTHHKLDLVPQEAEVTYVCN